MGAVETDEFIIAAYGKTLALISLEGIVIEQTDTGNEIQAIGAGKNNTIIIKNDEGIFLGEDALLSWQKTDTQPLIWSVPNELHADLKHALINKFRWNILPYERVLLDLHSGRVFGQAGVIIVDITGILLALLAISGSWIWLRHVVRSWRHKNRLH